VRAPLEDPDGGWAELMQLAATFPLEVLSFGSSRAAATVVLPKPRAVSSGGTAEGVDYDYVVDLVDGVGLSLATW
jgi:hypothetical protein